MTDRHQTSFEPAFAATLPDDDERALLRDTLRRQLADIWPAGQALALSADPQARATLWRTLAGQGLTSLGSAPAEGGLREIALVAEELGRAACPAPLVDVALANLALAPLASASPDATSFLSALHRGDAIASFAFGRFDGDACAGQFRFEDGRLDGEAAFAEGAADATHLLAIAEPGPVLAILPLAAAGVAVTETPGLARPALSTVRVARAPALALPLPGQHVEDLNRISCLLLVARALGAAQRGFDLAVEYAKERRQFGQPIGRFQALQHKLANCLIALEGSRLTLRNAAETYDYGSRDWRIFAAAARAFASPALRTVSFETQHTFGAVGYAEEHEAPRHFRRTHADLARHGGARRAREALAQHLLDDGVGLPEYDLGPAGNAFRDEVRAWLKENWTDATREAPAAGAYEEWGYDTQFTALLGRHGWNSLSWPAAHGGQARTAYEQLAFIEEVQQAGAPMGGRGDIQAHALISFGTSEQQAEFLPRLARGEITFCLGYSEPGSGSDLASLRTSAVRDGNDWVINGRKIWTTAAEKADYMWLAARTDPGAVKPHAGISVFIVPMDAPGLSVRPSMAMYGHTFCEECFDDVRVPANALVGEVNEGWKVLTSALATERIMMGSFIANARAQFERLAACVRSAADGERRLREDGAVRDRIGALAAEVEAGRQLFMQSVEAVARGQTPVHEAAMSKAYTGELLERLGEAALDLLGASGGLSEDAPGALASGRFEQLLYYSIPIVIGGGTAEIQRNLIAQRGLGLPR